MKTNRDVKKERYWRKVIRRQGKSGETIAHFCAREGVPAHQFYWWRRTLCARDRKSTKESQIASDGDESARQDQQADNSFVPVRLPWACPGKGRDFRRKTYVDSNSRKSSSA